MAPTRPFTPYSYATHIKNVCPQLQSVSTLVRKLRSPDKWFSRHKITFPIACTDGNTEPGPKPCQIFDELLPWNRLLWFVKVELKETRPGKLAVVSLPNAIFRDINRDEVRCAAVGLYWLLSQHHCVVSVEPPKLLLENYPELFWSALEQSTSVQALKLSNYAFDDESASLFFSAVSRSARLERIEWDHIRFLGDLSKQSCLTDWMTGVSSLKALKLTDIYGMSDARVFIEVLQTCPGLKELTVNAALVTDDTITLYRLLSGSASLTQLTIVGNNMKPACNIKFLFEGLVVNNVLQKLSFQHFCFELAESTLLSDMLSVNATLQELLFSSCYWELCTHPPAKNEARVQCEKAKDRWGPWWRVDPFVNAIKKSTSLQRLEFDEDLFIDEEMRRLLAAVKLNGSFKELCFRSLYRWPAIEFSHIVRDAGCTGKVAVDCCFSKSDQFMGAQVCTPELNSIRKHSFYDLCPERLQDLCVVLKSCDNVVALELTLKVGEVDEDCASFLANYLMSTTVLKEIDMNFHATSKAVALIIGGMSKNESLEKLSIRRWPEIDAPTICDWLERNTKLYYLLWLSFDPEVAAMLWMWPLDIQIRCRDLLKQLSLRLRCRYTLTYLCVEEVAEHEAEWQVVKNLLNRNASLVERAAHFVLGSSLKICTEAFELVSWHPLVLYRVQELAAVSASEAREKIRASLQRLKLEFWRLSGVVKEEFVCVEAKESEFQIDQLSFDAWQAVRKFLTVADVMDCTQSEA
ncbi:hypothetical protein HPB48_007279 [Haemaphysalis longicornis]|uniref:Uncharacterized protein n=1 Tax=Haemaphysalis longicornis TaxID=44386 RepID=A0A9J6FWR4_HAELO|nr:hypothetical protein HPB48_007279 [Haemaphysalis longicornis]